MLAQLDYARCQQQIPLGAHPTASRVFRALRRRFGIRSALRAALRPVAAPVSRLGDASRFAPGDWVRVLDRDRIQATLDSRQRLRGLRFVDQQWDYCEAVLPVTRVVRRMLDDHGKLRPVTRTVLLDRSTCAGTTGTAGCGRHCPLMFRDEWLERVEAPASLHADIVAGQRVAVRSVPEIQATLDRFGRHEGLLLMPEMLQYAGQTAHVFQKIETVYEFGRSLSARYPVFLLDGLFCSGAVLRDDGPCDRGCRLLWHRDWLDFGAR